MKSSLLTTTSALGIQPLAWNAFTQNANGVWQSIGAVIPLSTAVQLVVAPQQGMGPYPNMDYAVYPQMTVPAWLIPGVSIKLSLSVATPRGSIDISGYYVVKSVAANGLSFVVPSPSSIGSRNAAAITTAGTYTCDAGRGGLVTSPGFTLLTQCQEVVFKASAGTVIITPVVDITGAAPYPTTLTAGQTPEQEHKFTAQPGMKFDLGDWSVMTNSAGTLAVMFI